MIKQQQQQFSPILFAILRQCIQFGESCLHDACEINRLKGMFEFVRGICKGEAVVMDQVSLK